MHTLTPFEAGKNAKELGVDVTKPFISRKAKRRVTMEEIRKLLGEDVEIVDPLPTQQEEKAIYEKMYHVCSTGCPIPCPNKV